MVKYNCKHSAIIFDSHFICKIDTIHSDCVINNKLGTFAKGVPNFCLKFYYFYKKNIDMTKYKLIKKIAGSSSFRFNGLKFETRAVVDNQKVLKRLHNDGCVYVQELKESKKTIKKSIKNDTKKEDNNAND